MSNIDYSKQKRIENCFLRLKKENRGGLSVFITAGDPNYDLSLDIFCSLPDNGADIVELGMPFSDPVADGPTIQKAGIRALANGQNMKKTMAMVKEFRKKNDKTPLILMGYYNPILSYGTEKFINDCVTDGVDGLIIVDLPPEEDGELCLLAIKAGVNFIRLATPTTIGSGSNNRVKQVLNNSGGFIYYVAVNGITGDKVATIDSVRDALGELRQHTNLPIVTGFGIKNADDVRNTAKYADAAVVGSAIIDKIEQEVDNNSDDNTIKKSVLSFVKQLSSKLNNNN